MSISAPIDGKSHPEAQEDTTPAAPTNAAQLPGEQPGTGGVEDSGSAPAPFANTADTFGDNAFAGAQNEPPKDEEKDEESVSQSTQTEGEATSLETASGPNLPTTPGQTLPAQEDDADDEEDAADEEDEAAEDEEDKPMTLRDHFTELRKRLFWCFAFAILGFAICYPFAQEIFAFLVHPLEAALPAGSKFQYTAAHEAFFTYMKTAFIAGIFLTSPFIFYQVWAFIAPGLYDSEKMFVVPVSIASAIFFIGGGAFCYFVVFPFAFEFFMQYSNDHVIAMPTLKESFGFVLQMLVAFGLVFELPLFIFFLARLGLVTAEFLRQTRRYAILIIVIVAAILTPPDVISQALMAAPLYLLYEFSILVAQVFGKKKPKEDAEEEEEDEDEAEQGATKPDSAA